jgi:hypothetical protein
METGWQRFSKSLDNLDSRFSSRWAAEARAIVTHLCSGPDAFSDIARFSLPTDWPHRSGWFVRAADGRKFRFGYDRRSKRFYGRAAA